jgi:hypothetical protein
MKHTATFVTLFVLATVGLTTSSCTKTVTNQVNQVYSITYTIKPGDWLNHSATGPTDFNYSYVNLNVPEVDNIVVANGGVVVYLSFDNGTTFNTIPFVFNGYTYTTDHSNGQVYIQFHDEVSPSPLPPLPTSNVLAKVVILDGAALTP